MELAHWFSLLLLVFSLFLMAQHPIQAQGNPAYQLFNSQGKKVSYKRMIRKMSKADIVLFGEHHNNPICHWLQLEVVQDLDSLGSLVIGAEMFERDNEEVLAQYLAGDIDDKALDSLARLWKNYPTDYRPVVDYAKKQGLTFTGTNIPRRYASQVFRGGFEILDTLTAEEKSWIAPLPIAYDANLPGYQHMLTMMEGHSSENLPKAQAVKDATMAHFILEYYRPGQVFLHLNGTYHSDNFEGILWYLKKQRPELRYLTLSTVEQAAISRLDPASTGKADFILVVPENMTKTY